MNKAESKKVVLDTNVLVSALLAPESKPASIVSMVLSGKLLLYYDSRIITEYKTVLFRPKFPFQKRDVNILLNTFARIGASILAEPCGIHFVDASDQKFFEVAQSASAYLITGNGRHYPKHQCVVSPAEFLAQLKNQ